MSENRDSFSDLIAAIILYVILGVEVTLAIFALFAGGGAESQENLTVFILSTILGIVGATILFFLKFGQWIVGLRHLKKKFGWIGTIFHDPEYSILPKNKFLSFIKNPFLLALFFIPICSILGVIQVYQNTFWTALPQRVPQQITETAQGILSTIPADMEIWLPVALTGLLIMWIRWLKERKKIPSQLAWLLIFVVVPLIYTGLWAANHRFHHGDSELSMNYVALFGLISAYMLVLFMSVIPMWIFKITNNLYSYLNGAIESNETILMITVGINILFIVLFIFILSKRARSAKKT